MGGWLFGGLFLLGILLYLFFSGSAIHRASDVSPTGRGRERGIPAPPVQQRPPEIYPDRLVALNSPDTAGELQTA
jgi:hypothetical protein